MHSSIIDVRDKKLYVEWSKELNDTAIVLMHGLNSSIRLNDKLNFPDLKTIDSNHPIVRFDVRGHGKSEACLNPDDYSWKNLSLDLMALTNKLGLKQVFLVGSSMGAATSLYASLSFLRTTSVKVMGLVLLIPPTHGDSRERLCKIYNKFASILEEGGAKALVAHWRSLPPTQFFEREYPESREVSFQDFLEHGDSQSLAAAFQGSTKSRYPSSAELESFDIPTLILSRIDDPTHPVEAAQYLDKHLHNSRHLVAKTKEDVLEWPELISAFVNEQSSAI